MEFKLVLVAKSPEEFILHAEKPLAGLKFMEIAVKCLHRNLDTQTRMRHNTLGNISRYEISVPQSVAIESGWFTEKNVRYIYCDENTLSKYIFYGAAMSTCGTRRSCYPYMQDEIVLTSYIDEIAILNVWRNRGYPDEFNYDYDSDFDIDIVPDADDVDGPDVGDMVLDDLLQGKDSII